MRARHCRTVQTPSRLGKIYAMRRILVVPRIVLVLFGISVVVIEMGVKNLPGGSMADLSVIRERLASRIEKARRVLPTLKANTGCHRLTIPTHQGVEVVEQRLVWCGSW